MGQGANRPPDYGQGDYPQRGDVWPTPPTNQPEPPDGDNGDNPISIPAFKDDGQPKTRQPGADPGP